MQYDDYNVTLPAHVLLDIEQRTGFDAARVACGRDNFRGHTELFVGSQYIGCYDPEREVFIDDRREA